MALKGSRKGKMKATARANMTTLVINRCLWLDRNRMEVFKLEQIHGLIVINNVSGVKDERAWDLFHDRIFLDPVTTRHFSQFQLLWQHHRRRSSPFREWWAAFRSYIGQMFHKPHNIMNNLRWVNPHAFRDQVDCSDPQTTISAKIIRTGERFSRYSSNDLRAKIGPPSCRYYKPGDLLAVGPLNWDEIIYEDDDDDNWLDHGAPSGGRSCRSDGNENDDSESEEEMQGGDKRTGEGKRTKDGKGKGKRKAMENGKGKGKGNGKGKGIVKPTPEGNFISRAVTVHLQ